MEQTNCSILYIDDRFHQRRIRGPRDLSVRLQAPVQPLGLPAPDRLLQGQLPPGGGSQLPAEIHQNGVSTGPPTAAGVRRQRQQRLRSAPPAPAVRRGERGVRAGLRRGHGDREGPGGGPEVDARRAVAVGRRHGAQHTQSMLEGFVQSIWNLD